MSLGDEFGRVEAEAGSYICRHGKWNIAFS